MNDLLQFFEGGGVDFLAAEQQSSSACGDARPEPPNQMVVGMDVDSQAKTVQGGPDEPAPILFAGVDMAMASMQRRKQRCRNNVAIDAALVDVPNGVRCFHLLCEAQFAGPM